MRPTVAEAIEGWKSVTPTPPAGAEVEPETGIYIIEGAALGYSCEHDARAQAERLCVANNRPYMIYKAVAMVDRPVPPVTWHTPAEYIAECKGKAAKK
jgi:hypothetical protein